MNFSTLDLNLLRVFDAMLREGSTARAGQRVGLSQPAVSAALGRLRRALGDELFVRKGQGMVPTDYARNLEVPLRQALEGLEAMLQTRPFDPAASRAVFRFSGTDFFAGALMPHLARILATEAPGMKIQHVDLVPDANFDMLDHHQLDLALLPEANRPEWVDAMPLFKSGFHVIARRGNNRLAAAGVAPGDVIPLDLFCDLGHVLCSPDGKLKAMGDDALAAVGRTRRVVMTTPFFWGIFPILESTDFIALAPRQLVDDVRRHEEIDVYRPPVEMPEPVIAMYWHKRSTNAPAHRWFREQVAAILRQLDNGDAARA